LMFGTSGGATILFGYMRLLEMQMTLMHIPH